MLARLRDPGNLLARQLRHRRSLKTFVRSLLAAAALAAAPAVAQQYPVKTIRFVAPFPPGGGVDIVSRAIADKLSPRLGQPIVVENKPGAGMTIGTDLVAKSAPDGYTLLVSPIGSQGIVHHMYPRRTFDFPRDFAPVARIGYGTIAFIVPQSSPARSVKEFVALAKANPGKLTFASSGTGALIHLTGEMFKQAAGVDLTHIPYKGTTQLLPDLMDGRINMALDSLPAYLPHLKSGKVRALAVASRERARVLPELPTMAEAGTPREIIALLNREMNAVLQIPDLREKLAAQGIEIVPGTPESVQAELLDEIAKWGRVIAAAKLKPE
jgi:tripartite-type tricarboxylate transporter receptor subunit TctC